MSDKVSADPAAPGAISTGGTRLELLGLPLDPVTLETALDTLSGWLTGPRSPHTVVTLNPEFIIQSRENEAKGDFTFTQAMQKADLVTAGWESCGRRRSCWGNRCRARRAST